MYYNSELQDIILDYIKSVIESDESEERSMWKISAALDIRKAIIERQAK